MRKTDDVAWLEFVETRIFSKQISTLPKDILTSIQSDLVGNPERGDIVKGRTALEKRELQIRARHEGRVVAIVICTFTSNMWAGFTYCIYSAKVSKPTYP